MLSQDHLHVIIISVTIIKTKVIALVPLPLPLTLVSTMYIKLMVVLHAMSFVAQGNINPVFIVLVEVPNPEEEEVVKAGDRSSRTCEDGVDTTKNDSSEGSETDSMMTVVEEGKSDVSAEYN